MIGDGPRDRQTTDGCDWRRRAQAGRGRKDPFEKKTINLRIRPTCLPAWVDTDTAAATIRVVRRANRLRTVRRSDVRNRSKIHVGVSQPSTRNQRQYRAGLDSKSRNERRKLNGSKLSEQFIPPRRKRQEKRRRQNLLNNCMTDPSK